MTFWASLPLYGTAVSNKELFRLWGCFEHPHLFLFSLPLRLLNSPTHPHGRSISLHVAWGAQLPEGPAPAPGTSLLPPGRPLQGGAGDGMVMAWRRHGRRRHGLGMGGAWFCWCQVGWKHGALIQRLESQRKASSFWCSRSFKIWFYPTCAGHRCLHLRSQLKNYCTHVLAKRSWYKPLTEQSELLRLYCSWVFQTIATCSVSIYLKDLESRWRVKPSTRRRPQAFAPRTRQIQGRWEMWSRHHKRDDVRTGPHPRDHILQTVFRHFCGTTMDRHPQPGCRISTKRY